LKRLALVTALLVLALLLYFPIAAISGLFQSWAPGFLGQFVGAFFIFGVIPLVLLVFSVGLLGHSYLKGRKRRPLFDDFARSLNLEDGRPHQYSAGTEVIWIQVDVGFRGVFAPIAWKEARVYFWIEKVRLPRTFDRDNFLKQMKLLPISSPSFPEGLKVSSDTVTVKECFTANGIWGLSTAYPIATDNVERSGFSRDPSVHRGPQKVPDSRTVLAVIALALDSWALNQRSQKS
jgi:hypothetical protein